MNNTISSSWDMVARNTIVHPTKKHKNLLEVKHITGSKIIRDSMEELGKCATKESVVELYRSKFAEAGLDTPWTKMFLVKLAKTRNLQDAMIYAVNAMCKGAGLSLS